MIDLYTNGVRIIAAAPFTPEGGFDFDSIERLMARTETALKG